MSSVLKRWLDSRWFCLADVACAAIGGFWWYSQPGIGPWPLLIALAPWALRLASRRFPVRRTSFDILVIVFLSTALMGVWAAYDREGAWAKLWVLVGAALLYYALAAQPEANHWLLSGALSLLGAAIAGYFLLTYDWQAFPRHFAALDRLGTWWMSVRPSFTGFLPPNVAGGLLAMLLPFPIAGLILGWRDRRWLFVLFNLSAGGLATLGLLLTSSRGAWGALVIALAVGGLWQLGGLVARRLRWPKRPVSGAVVSLALGAGLLVILRYPGGLEALAKTVPDGQSRYDIAHNTLRLVADFPFTGGGLGAFTGLYSRYMLVIFVPYLTYSHDLFLDVALEQGLVGLLGLLGMMVGSLALLGGQRQPGQGNTLLRWALATATWVVALHGLLDDALYGNRGTPLVLVLAGLSIALARPLTEPGSRKSVGPDKLDTGAPRQDRRLARAFVIGSVIASGLLLYMFGPRLAGAWYADLGSVEMARVELAGWPNTPWDQAIPGGVVGPSQALFEQALRFDPANRTAQQRSGLIAERQDDYPTAVADLEAAYRVDPGHRGVAKSLGDDYVWLGQIERARDLLAPIPEAAEQMDAFARWWNEHGRPDRAANAAQMAALLRGSATALRSP